MQHTRTELLGRIPVLPSKILAWDTAARKRELKKLEVLVKQELARVKESMLVEEAEVEFNAVETGV